MILEKPLEVMGGLTFGLTD